MTAEVRHKAQRFERILTEDEHPRRQALEATKNLKHILAVIADRHGLTIRPDVDEFLDDLPGLGIDDDTGAVMRFRIQHGDEHLAAVH